MTTELKAAAAEHHRDDAVADAYTYITQFHNDPTTMEIHALRNTNQSLAARVIELHKKIDELHHEMDDLRRGKERMRRERDELSLLIIQMRKRIADIMHSSLDDLK
jgi:uncharacterized coiled-coil DUF342 family protein